MYLYRVLRPHGLRQPFDVAVEMMEFIRFGWKAVPWFLSWLIGLLGALRFMPDASPGFCIVSMIVAYLISASFDRNLWIMRHRFGLREPIYCLCNGLVIALAFGLPMKISESWTKLLINEAIIIAAVVIWRALDPLPLEEPKD